MVNFGGYTLAHVLAVQIQESRVIHDRLIPSAMKRGSRSDETAGGRIITVQGEIRNDPDYVLRIEEIRVRADDIARALDFEDGSATINVKLGMVEAVWTVEDGLLRPAYSTVFHETS